jgi:hypothetical protein
VKNATPTTIGIINASELSCMVSLLEPRNHRVLQVERRRDTRH